jgi:CheY-like chemotaxis protein
MFRIHRGGRHMTKAFNTTDVIDISGRQPRVLVVDDDPDALAFISDRCRKMGLAVQTTTSGLHALAMMRQHRPDALIVDVHMPGLDGVSLCARMLDPDQIGIDVIVISGYEDLETAERCGKFGATYVRKGPELWPTVQSALDVIFPGMTVEKPEASISASASIRKRPLILVIDDDPDVGKFLTTRLRKCGVDVLFTTDGKQGYDLAVREKPNVILSDYFMPVANINFLLWRLRSTPSIEKTPVFAMTSRKLDAPIVERLMQGHLGQRGVERIFHKPLDIDQLFFALKEHCALDYVSPRGDLAPPRA